MTGIRRKDKEITDVNEAKKILKEVKYVTLAMCLDNEPYLVTLSHGYHEEKNCIDFHCAKEGKKIQILQANNRVRGQALVNQGYVQGACDHLHATTQFSGKVTFVEDVAEKEHALKLMIESLDYNLEELMKKQLLPRSVSRVRNGKIDIDYMSGKKADKVNSLPIIFRDKAGRNNHGFFSTLWKMTGRFFRNGENFAVPQYAAARGVRFRRP
jgi:nitroimidazol reductase NimA-like FMN-containing flavoprotein (pyridoxamine 5'-phosphate oxidase superfamily)